MSKCTPPLVSVMEVTNGPLVWQFLPRYDWLYPLDEVTHRVLVVVKVLVQQCSPAKSKPLARLIVSSEVYTANSWRRRHGRHNRLFDIAMWYPDWRKGLCFGLVGETC